MEFGQETTLKHRKLYNSAESCAFLTVNQAMEGLESCGSRLSEEMQQ